MSVFYPRRFVTRFAAILACVVLSISSGCIDFGRKTTNTTGISTPAERIAALRQMRNNANQATTVDSLSRSFREEDDVLIRAEIVRTAASYPGGASDSLLQLALRDEAKEVRVAACECLGQRGNAEAVKPLADAAGTNADTDVRLAAIEALGETGSQEAYAALHPALLDEDPAIQRRAVISLEKISGKNLGGNVYRWQKYVKGELPDSEQQISIAERLRSIF